MLGAGILLIGVCVMGGKGNIGCIYYIISYKNIIIALWSCGNLVPCYELESSCPVTKGAFN